MDAMVMMIFLLLPIPQEPPREIAIEAVVAGTPREVFDLWVSREGVRSFFAPDAVIDPREGGEYTIIFAPKEDPQGLSHGTKGARILKFEPPHRLTFEWITFTLPSVEGVPGPPAVNAAERNVSPLPTAVELTFTPRDSKHTLVRLRHRGFQRGEKWDGAYDFFSKVWPAVLDELTRSRLRAPTPRSPASPDRS